jgi:hypothetical protein
LVIEVGRILLQALQVLHTQLTTLSKTYQRMKQQQIKQEALNASWRC